MKNGILQKCLGSSEPLDKKKIFNGASLKHRHLKTGQRSGKNLRFLHPYFFTHGWHYVFMVMMMLYNILKYVDRCFSYKMEMEGM